METCTGFNTLDSNVKARLSFPNHNTRAQQYQTGSDDRRWVDAAAAAAVDVVVGAVMDNVLVSRPEVNVTI
jgi:uncharacterized protein YceK